MAGEIPILKSHLPMDVQESLEHRIIPIVLLGEQEEPPEPTVEVHITGDTELSDPSGETVARLRYGAVVINGLLLAQGWTGNRQIRSIGPIGSHSSFNRRLSEIRDGLAAITGLPEPVE